MMRVRSSTILLKDLVATDNLILIFQCNGKHVFGINSMTPTVSQSKITKGVTLLEETSNQIITFDGNFRLCLMSPFLYWDQHDLLPTFDHFKSYRHHQCQRTSHPTRRILIVSSFRKFVRIQFANVFPFDLLIIGKQWLDFYFIGS